MVFDKPPVVELIAELRWLPPGINIAVDNPGNIQVPAMFFAGAQPESMYMAFGAGINQRGYTQVERLMVSGMPQIPFQPVYRYAIPVKPDEGRSLFHLGPGVFSAHTTPPYRKWSDFRPTIELGVTSLLAARSAAERDEPFISTTVRYVDSFTAEYRDGKSGPSFLADVLGFRLSIPEAIADMLAEGGEIAPQFRLVLPVKGGFHLGLNAADGNVNGNPGMLLDWTLSSANKVAANLSDIMGLFDAAHDLLSTAFVKLTSALHDKMELHS
jgi:uncharacterized protein (TIGR04255 family)